VPPALFDPVLELALDVARKGEKARPKVAAPARIQPFLRFSKVPSKAKQTVFEVLDGDAEFRARVAKAANEKTAGRAGMAFLERPPGWEELVDRLVDASEEPIIADTGDARRLAKKLDVAERGLVRAESERDELQVKVDELEAQTAHLANERDDLSAQLRALREERDDLSAQRQRAVSELKTTESVMARHIAERKRLEALLESMTAAQLSSTAVGGGVTDAEVLASLDAAQTTMHELTGHLEQLRSRATVERVPVARRSPLPVPPGLFDDSVEYAEYLLSVPNMWVLVDGYNVTKEAHPELSIEEQRRWLEGQLVGASGTVAATFGIVYDGADSGSEWMPVGSGVRARFTASGVEADDVIINQVAALDPTRAVTVVSSDRRVRDGAAAGGANVIYSRQLLDWLS